MLDRSVNGFMRLLYHLQLISNLNVLTYTINKLVDE